MNRIFKLWALYLCLSILSGGFTYARTLPINKVTGTSISSQLSSVINGDTVVIEGNELQSSPNDWWALKSKLATTSFVLVLQTDNNTIPNGALFHGNDFPVSNLIGIDMPNVKTIGRQSFMDCIYLEFIKLPQVQTIDYQAFRDCSILDDINLL